jgi:hypothetical protein
MMIVPAGVKVHLGSGYTDMRKGMNGLAMPGRVRVAAKSTRMGMARGMAWKKV